LIFGRERRSKAGDIREVVVLFVLAVLVEDVDDSVVEKVDMTVGIIGQRTMGPDRHGTDLTKTLHDVVEREKV